MTEVERLAREFRMIWKALEDGGRRSAATQMTGKVAEIDGNRVRLELLPADPRTGKAFLSPWVQLQDAAGSTASHTPVAVGDPMRLLSPNGEMGPASLAIRDSHTRDNPNPSDDPERLVLTHAGCTLSMEDGKLTIACGDTRVELTEGVSAVYSGEHTHNGINVGDTHRHAGVMAGGGQTGTPV